jgi:uncharacterized membrane protein YbhN (UPF0104 family)
VRDHAEDFARILGRPMPPGPPALLALAVLLAYWANAEAVRAALLAHGAAVPRAECLALTLSTSAANTLLPFKGAVALRAWYLKERHGLALADFLSQSLAVGLAALSAASLAGLVSLLALRGAEPGAALILESYFALALALPAALAASGRLPFRPPGRLGALWRSWGRYRERPGILLRVALWDAAFFLLWALANRQSLAAFGIALGPAETLFYSAGQIHTLIINLTPAGLGVTEAWSVFAGQILGFTPAEALLAQGLARLETFLALAVSGLWGWGYLSRLGKAWGMREGRGKG